MLRFMCGVPTFSARIPRLPLLERNHLGDEDLLLEKSSRTRTLTAFSGQARGGCNTAGWYVDATVASPRAGERGSLGLAERMKTEE